MEKVMMPIIHTAFTNPYEEQSLFYAHGASAGKSRRPRQRQSMPSENFEFRYRPQKIFAHELESEVVRMQHIR